MNLSEITKEDLEHLKWIHDRLVYRHNEDPTLDYMKLLRKITGKIKKAITKEALNTPDVGEVWLVKLPESYSYELKSVTIDRVTDKAVKFSIMIMPGTERFSNHFSESVPPEYKSFIYLLKDVQFIEKIRDKEWS